MKKDFVYLASASPRRSELLRQIGVPFQVRPAAIDEEPHEGERPEAYVVRLAAAKAETIWAAAVGDSRAVLAADRMDAPLGQLEAALAGESEANRQRRVVAAGGMPALLADLVARTADLDG